MAAAQALLRFRLPLQHREKAEPPGPLCSGRPSLFQASSSPLTPRSADQHASLFVTNPLHASSLQPDEQFRFRMNATRRGVPEWEPDLPESSRYVHDCEYVSAVENGSDGQQAWQGGAGNGFGTDVEIVRDEEWERRMRKETDERATERARDKETEFAKEDTYRSIAQQLRSLPQEDVKQARKLVANLVRAGENVEEMIAEAADNGELTPLTLLVIKSRLDLARHDDERNAIQALDLLYRRVETEIWSRNASPAYQLLNELLNLHDGFSREEWLRRCRRIMLQVFPPEDAFSILGGPNMDLSNHSGPIEMPEEDDALLRIDFIREVNEFLIELQAQQLQPVSGFDPASVAVRLRQEERQRAIEQVVDLRDLAVKLQW